MTSLNRGMIKTILGIAAFVSVVTFAPKNNIQAAQKSSAINFAEEMAENFVDTTIGANENCGQWEIGMIIRKTRELYNADNTISAYCIEYQNSNNKESGYVVVGANEKYPPIVEFAFEGSFANTDEKLYYLGDESYDYYKKDSNNELQGISTKKAIGSCEDIEKEQKKERKKHTGDFSKEWKEARDGFETEDSEVSYYVGNSNPPYKKDDYAINDPSKFEKGYFSVVRNNVKKYNSLSYFYDQEFKGYGDMICSPLAATNLIKYWYMRDNKKYNGLMYKKSWESTFSQLYSDMGTNFSGTYVNMIDDGIKKYLNRQGFKSSKITYTKNPSFSKVTTEIGTPGAAGYPFLLCLKEHYAYDGNHTVLVIGYVQYIYKEKQKAINNSTTSNYLRVVDGSYSGTERYVHFTIGHKSSEKVMITVRPAR